MTYMYISTQYYNNIVINRQSEESTESTPVAAYLVTPCHNVTGTSGPPEMRPCKTLLERNCIVANNIWKNHTIIVGKILSYTI